MDKFIEISDVTKSYWSADGKMQTEVLLPLSLNIAEGEMVMFLGPSGCGKTTLMRIVGGLEKQDQGMIRLAGDLLAVQTGAEEWYSSLIHRSPGSVYATISSLARAIARIFQSMKKTRSPIIT